MRIYFQIPQIPIVPSPQPNFRYLTICSRFGKRLYPQFISNINPCFFDKFLLMSAKYFKKVYFHDRFPWGRQVGFVPKEHCPAEANTWQL